MGTTLLLALAAFVAGSRPVRIPSLRVDVVPIHPFVLLALAVAGGSSAVLVGIAGLLGAAVGRSPRPAASRLASNLAIHTVAIATAAWVAGRIGGQAGAPAAAWTWPMAAATGVYFLVGTGLVAGAIALDRRQGYFATWNRSLRWTFLPYAMGFTVAIAALAVFAVSEAAGLLVTIAPCWCLTLAYRAEALRHTAAAVRG